MLNENYLNIGWQFFWSYAIFKLIEIRKQSKNPENDLSQAKLVWL